LIGADWTGDVSIGPGVIGPGVIGVVLIGVDVVAPSATDLAQGA
jgi:hypothetical protein